MRIGDARATIFLAALTAAASLLILAADQVAPAAIQGGFIPLRLLVDGGPHDFLVPAFLTPLSATLVHGGLAHLALNLAMFAFCGVQVERVLGSWAILILYVVGAYAAAAGHYAIVAASQVPMIGASGAISAVIAAYAMLFGQRRTQGGGARAEVLHVVWLAAAWIGIQLLIGFAGLGGLGSIAIGAHIGGFIAGLALTRPLLRWRYRHA